jgi:hypothetical protein
MKAPPRVVVTSSESVVTLMEQKQPAPGLHKHTSKPARAMSSKERVIMNHPILPSHIDAYVRQHQRELEQRIHLNEQLRLAAEANAPPEQSGAATAVPRLSGLVQWLVGLLHRRPDPAEAGQEFPALKAD